VTTRLAFRTIVRLVAAGATILSVGCADGPTAPVTRSIQSTNAASHDDPPEGKCASGWVQVDGRWVCDEGH
jgi:hypothetical protein